MTVSRVCVDAGRVQRPLVDARRGNRLLCPVKLDGSRARASVIR